MTKKFERIFTNKVELFAKENTDGLPVIKGYATKYGELSSLYWGEFYVRFNKHMFDGVLADPNLNCIANLEHVNPEILGRAYPSRGVESLKLTSDDIGLYFEVTLANTSRARDAVEDVRAGNILGCSCAIKVADERWTDFHEGYPIRDILVASELRDVCLTVEPAIEATEVGLSKYSKDCMTKEDLLALKAAAVKKTPPREYFERKFKYLSLDKK